MQKSISVSTARTPAIHGGRPVFPDGLPFVRPAVPASDLVADDVRRILGSGLLTNGRYVRELEARSADHLGVRHVVAVASCTTGLLLVLRAAGLSGDVVLPAFTFVATAHAVAWNGLRPVFADIDPGTLTLSPADAGRAAGIRASAILATHTFGTPCDVGGLQDVARANGVSLFFDAAHAFGSRHPDGPVGGFGDAEVFSLSPTKVLVAGEGGLIATNDDLLAKRCRLGRDYANPGDYDARFVGLNARMSEFHAAVALRSLEDLDERIERRNELAALYTELLSPIPGISFPQVPDGCRSTYKDYTIVVDDRFGLTVADLRPALAAEGIETKPYYAPPVHQQQAYRPLAWASRQLPVTERLAPRVLTLPLWSDLTEQQVRSVVDAIERIHAFASTIAPTASGAVVEDGAN